MRIPRGNKAACGAVLALVALGALASCAFPNGGGSGGVTLLYMTDTENGRVYTYDPVSHTSSSVSLLSVGQPAAGAMAFFAGVGYVAVGNNFSGNQPGLYSFNPSATVPQAARIGMNVSAQYVDIYSSTKGYLAVADYPPTSSNSGLYTFDPSNPQGGLSGPIPGTSGLPSAPGAPSSSTNIYPQDVVTGPDGRIYLADNNNQEVLQIDPTTDTVLRAFPTLAAGTTGLAAGYRNGDEGIFVANTGGYSGSAPLPGSIDFIDVTTNTVSKVTSGLPEPGGPTQAIYPAHVAVVGTDAIAATGSTRTLLVVPSSGATTELLSGSASVAGTDIAVAGGLIYVAEGDYSTKTSRLYVFDSAGNEEPWSPLVVMRSGEDLISNLAFYN